MADKITLSIQPSSDYDGSGNCTIPFDASKVDFTTCFHQSAEDFADLLESCTKASNMVTIIGVSILSFVILVIIVYGVFVGYPRVRTLVAANQELHAQLAEKELALEHALAAAAGGQASLSPSPIRSAHSTLGIRSNASSIRAAGDRLLDAAGGPDSHSQPSISSSDSDRIMPQVRREEV